MHKTEFEKFACLDRGISSMNLARYSAATDNYINPTIIEERKLNMSQIDVFSRLLMDRIIFLGVPIDDDVANIIQAQLLFLASTDPKADITMYLNTPGGQVTSGLGIYDTMQLIQPDVATVCTGMAASMGSVLLCAGAQGKRSALPHSKVLIHQPLDGDAKNFKTLLHGCSTAGPEPVDTRSLLPGFGDVARIYGNGYAVTHSLFKEGAVE